MGRVDACSEVEVTHRQPDDVFRDAYSALLALKCEVAAIGAYSRPGAFPQFASKPGSIQNSHATAWDAGQTPALLTERQSAKTIPS